MFTKLLNLATADTLVISVFAYCGSKRTYSYRGRHDLEYSEVRSL